MKKLKPHEVRGKAAEERLIALARSLKRGHPWLGHVRKAGVKHDDASVDVIIYAYTLTGTEEKKKVLPVALQVKSSRAGVRKFYQKHSEAHRTGVMSIVVNDWRSDKVILRDIARAISRGLFVPGRAERVAEFLNMVRRSQTYKRSRTEVTTYGGIDHDEEKDILPALQSKRRGAGRPLSRGAWGSF